jgi:hypothetical protein
MDRISDINFQLAEVKKELAEIEDKRDKLIQHMDQLREKRYHLLKAEINESVSSYSQINKHSSEEDKISLFRSLFRGREDVFPKRFENKKQNRKGYQPPLFERMVIIPSFS